MAVSVASFKAAYPAFRLTDETMLAARLAEVEACTSDLWAEKRDLAVCLQLADALTNDPMGRDAQVTDNQETAYRRRFVQLSRALACGNSIRLGTVAPEDLCP